MAMNIWMLGVFKKLKFAGNNTQKTIIEGVLWTGIILSGVALITIIVAMIAEKATINYKYFMWAFIIFNILFIVGYSVIYSQFSKLDITNKTDPAYDRFTDYIFFMPMVNTAFLAMVIILWYYWTRGETTKTTKTTKTTVKDKSDEAYLKLENARKERDAINKQEAEIKKKWEQNQKLKREKEKNLEEARTNAGFTPAQKGIPRDLLDRTQALDKPIKFGNFKEPLPARKKTPPNPWNI